MPLIADTSRQCQIIDIKERTGMLIIDSYVGILFFFFWLVTWDGILNKKSPSAQRLTPSSRGPKRWEHATRTGPCKSESRCRYSFAIMRSVGHV